MSSEQYEHELWVIWCERDGRALNTAVYREWILMLKELKK